MAETQPFDEYLASVSASTTGVSMVPGLNGAGTSVIAATLPVQSILDRGVTGDGTTDDTAALQAAALTGQHFIIPSPASFYRITDKITFADGTVFEGDGSFPELRMDSASNILMFELPSVSGAKIIGLSINGNNTVTPDGAASTILLSSCTDCEVRGNRIYDTSLSGSGVGDLLISGTSSGNRIVGNTFTDCLGSGVGLSGSSVINNQVLDNSFTDCGYFGIRLGEGANKNEIAFNRTLSNGIELVGLTRQCFQNRIHDNHAENCGDNGISISGNFNTVTGNVCVLNNFAGIGVWGSFNTISGNVCLNNNQTGGASSWSGVTILNGFGGVGQHNVVMGNTCDDDQTVPTQQYGVAIGVLTYTLHAAAQVVAVGAYRYFGLNVYVAATAGTTGATNPVHTSGTVSDGSVDWTYVTSFLVEASSIRNMIIGNSVIRYAVNSYQDAASTFTKNEFLGTQVIELQGANRCRIDGTASVDLSVGGTSRIQVNTADFRPVTDIAVSNGLVNRRWSHTYSSSFWPGAGLARWTSGGGSPEGVLTAVVGALWTRTDGGAATTFYVKESGAGNTGWVAK